jgi:cell division protein FtsQ
MSELERDLNRNNVASDPSRARKRKLKRQNGPNMPTTANQAADTRRAFRQRAGSRKGPSIRERLVTAQMKISSNSFSSLQGKLSSKLGLDSSPAKDKPYLRTPTALNSEGSGRKSRHQMESRRSETRYKATPRTETQRIANTDAGFQARKIRRTYEARSEATPPVMVRGGMNGMAFGRVASSRLNKQRAPKRRIDVPLKVTGAEVRLPSLPFIQLGWRVVSLLMVMMMSACLILIWKAPVFQVSSINAEGLKRLTVSDLNAVMGIFGKPVFMLNPNSLNETLKQAFPEFAKVSVRVNLPAKVKVVVTERVPVIAWVQDGVETWVDAQGISFPPRGEPKSALVRVEGYGTPPSNTAATLPTDQLSLPGVIISPSTPNNPTLRLTPELVDSIIALGAKMPAETILVFDSEHGLGWNDPHGWEVFFGAEDQDMEMKLIVYQALVERLQNEGIQPALISVEYVHAPYYRMER